MHEMEPTFISVVVPTRNHAPLLRGLLSALEAQDYPAFEVVVVDDASTDDTWMILQEWQRPHRVALRGQQPGGSYAARNRGWKAARGAFVAFTDDDCLPQPGWLSALAQALSTPQISPNPERIVATQGVTLARPGTITPFTHQIEQKEPGPPYRTCNIAYRRDALERLGGFDDTLHWYADNILGLRAREIGTIAFAPEAVVLHPPRRREWRDREAWRARFAADAAHRQVLYRHTAEPRVPRAFLPVVLWIVRPLAKQSAAHLRYLARHPIRYGRGIVPMAREKGEMLLALIAFWRERRARPARPESLPTLPDRPLVSVVIATAGRPHLLEGTLAALAHQTWPHREVLVVERVPPGDSEGSARRWEARYMTYTTGGLGTARDLGFRSAAGDIIAFTDDDCLPDSGWLEALVRSFRSQPQLWGVQGRTEAETGPIGSHAVRVHRLDSLYQTCNIAYRREALERVGGFDRRFHGWFEDTALGARVAERGWIGFERAALVIHRAIPRTRRDRATWTRILEDERRLATIYPDFYRKTRGRKVLLSTIVHWLLGSPIKALLRELPRAGEDPRGYLALALLLVAEEAALLRVMGNPRTWTGRDR